MHLIIYFCGTGEPGQTFHKKQYGLADARKNNQETEYLNQPNIKRILVKGCEHPEICGSTFSTLRGLFPNLNAFARRFVSGLFKINTIKGDEEKEAKRVLLLKSLSSIGIDLDNSSDGLDEINEKNPIESITLCGYSRGAVTCFNVARALDRIAPEVPVNIVANQPVPGNAWSLPGTNAHSVADCSDLKNLKKVSIILGSYTGHAHPSNFTRFSNRFYRWVVSKCYKWFHRSFFSQVVPKLPRKVQRDLIVIPRQLHHQNTMTGDEHMHMQLARYLNQQDDKLVSDQVVQDKSELSVRNKLYWDGAPLYPPQSELQEIFGLSQSEAYRHLDKLHPLRGLRSGHEFGEDEKIFDWWQKEEKNASYFSSALTKQLVASIKETDDEQQNSTQSLKNLFSKADRWLLFKANTNSSRYNQVVALRNNLYYRLIDEKKVNSTELALLNHDNLYQNKYFLNYWQRASSEASFFKTPQTVILDQAFLIHSRASVSEKNDRDLLDAMDAWITAKENSSSKRWSLVTKMREHLFDTINQCYVNTAKTYGM